ncbi:hypothetical protein SD71_00375 [Cohnella kolymensis]|uniref:DUF1292 domain-containing protein n=1 Tax=Cohnella kolymensis TaxID=1590652 RepID=A0ABR5A8B4_9BACL|nr:DUF1292 domain-containing protein [Cohnella kolymensis]KIL37221.1 hypothetical protein SD71_00375 [Cohnella kolymensis]
MSAQQLPSLKELFGDTVELNAEAEAPESFRILAELTVGGNRYAVLQSETMKIEEEIEVFRVLTEPDGGLQLETVEDDEEWDRVSEAYDDLQFGSDDQP